MLKHIVMWKFKDAEGKTKDENIEIVKNGLEALPPMISHIKKLTFLKNQVECERNFDALLVVETENEEELQKYKVHPEHKKVAAYVAKVTEGRGAVDIYEQAKKRASDDVRFLLFILRKDTTAIILSVKVMNFTQFD